MKKTKEKFETLISRAELRNNIFDLPIKNVKKDLIIQNFTEKINKNRRNKEPLSHELAAGRKSFD